MNADEPAYPSPESTKNYAYTGITKRELIAAMALQGLLTDPVNVPMMQDVAKSAVDYADALIAELSK